MVMLPLCLNVRIATLTNNLVIVESPAKAKTIKKYLGKGFDVLASFGHVRDLIPRNGAVDTNDDFAMKYELISKNSKHVDAILKAMKKADNLYLATDPDREGEAISWHVKEILEERKVLKEKGVYRIVFNEITKTAIQAAVESPRDIAMDLVDAQQARRALDYLVGFNLSPLLWKKIRKGLSAGRVQSPALRLIVERELEIEKFIAQEYWTVRADLLDKKQQFFAKLTEFNHEKIKQFSITDGERAAEVKQGLLAAADGHLLVDKVEKKQRKRNPTAPFITSTLQQEAARKLGFTAQRTMRIAQQLYEGIDIGDGAIGLITYMRTDSVHLADEAVNEIRDFIKTQYGAKDVPSTPRKYQTKTKNAQEAHEAIRPTSVNHRPSEIKKALSIEQAKLYELIWKRTVASQMIHATIDTVAIDFACGEHRLRANGSSIANPGFMKVYMEDVDDKSTKEDDEKFLPALEVGQKIALTDILAEQHFTEPPPRYSEASLIKSLEEFGIGRPSTYAAIISTLVNREYVVLDKKRFMPTDVGRVVHRFLKKYFTQYVDFDFTAHLEDKLDEIARGERGWIPLLDEFWQPFKSQVTEIEKTVKRSDVVEERIDEKCPKCSEPLAIRLGRTGFFIGCTAYPDCNYTRNVDGSSDDSNAPEIVPDRACPQCGAELFIKTGRYGKFIGCSKYPDCNFIESLNKPEDTGVECPECHKGSLLKRQSRRGKVFYSCSTYPTCSYAIWNEPLDQPCPTCKWPILSIKETKRQGKMKMCPQKECDYSIAIEGE